MLGAENIINKEKYPLDQPKTDVWKTLAKNCKSSFQQSGVAILKNFVQQPILDRMIAETDSTIHRSHFCKDNHNVFFEEDDNTLPADHPLRMREDTSLNSIPHDLMNPQDALHLYRRYWGISYFVWLIPWQRSQLIVWARAKTMAGIMMNHK